MTGANVVLYNDYIHDGELVPIEGKGNYHSIDLNGLGVDIYFCCTLLGGSHEQTERNHRRP
ncbi:hypothetical protein DFQ01_12850 [Paenibacillus cellulosilyticus]|uniref:Uncharacterized protein n=1 Tax=Paenibacillus cellulosilyticus TaxID=375489 RepID=A0A2V2YM66_9BACL|nr:hypothetical protein DFQ01_12850 [Paenibacillus cellulosilyticus]